MNAYVERVLNDVKRRYADQPEFIQAVTEVFGSLELMIQAHPEYEKHAVLERLVEPERAIIFRVPVEMDDHHIEVCRGYRVQYNGAVGPYKGGLRFHPSVNLGVIKFLGFEQIFKNALTTLPMGGAKGGSDFNPKGKTDSEVRRFCQSFMKELYRHIGPDTDVPAGDMGVGAREIGYLYGEYRRLMGTNTQGVLTGKGLSYGGSLTRKQATGYGLVYFLQEILKRNPIEQAKVIVSGSGNVAIYAVEKCQQLGYQVIAISDSSGYVVDEQLDLEVIKTIKEVNRGSLKDYPSLAGKGCYYEGSVYDCELKADIVLPCGTQNEIDLARAERIVRNGVRIVAEGANMPDSNEAIEYYKTHGVIFAPGKAANAGGVATSGLEMSQNAQHFSWSFEEVDEKLHGIMVSIHNQCVEACKEYGLEETDYVAGANLAAAKKVIDAMLAQGEY